MTISRVLSTASTVVWSLVGLILYRNPHRRPVISQSSWSLEKVTIISIFASVASGIFNQESFFLGIVAIADPFGNTEIQGFISETSEDGVTSIRHEDIGDKPRRYHLETKTVDSESKSDLDVVSETLEVMEEFDEKYEDMTTNELLKDAC